VILRAAGNCLRKNQALLLKCLESSEDLGGNEECDNLAHKIVHENQYRSRNGCKTLGPWFTKIARVHELKQRREAHELAPKTLSKWWLSTQTVGLLAAPFTTSGGRNTIGIQYIFQYFGFFGYFMEYNTARSIPILFLVEYRIPWNTVFHMISVFQRKSVFKRNSWNTVFHGIRYYVEHGLRHFLI
jgi:hypothetical protein